ncbi:MAG: hypothetical protein ACLQEQ_09525 [Nitrososphaerales archaeon]
MSKKVPSDDVAVLLYMVPFIASGVYALYLGVAGGVSHVLSPTVYLTVTRDPILFLLGTLSVLLGVVFEVSSTSPAGRPAKLGSVSSTLQVIAAASFVLALICALYAHGFSDLSGAASDFVTGRFSLIFPILLVFFSYLITAPFNIGSIGKPTVLGIIAMLLVPVSVYEIGKRNTVVGLGAALVLLIVGFGFFLMSTKKVPGQGKVSGAGP